MAMQNPKVSISIIPAQQLAGVTEQRALIVGQMLAAGTATSGVVQRDFPNDGSEDTLFGAKSHVAGLVRSFKKINKVSYLDVLPLSDNGAAVKAAATLTFVGDATGDGEIVVSVCSEADYKRTIQITSGTVIADIAAAVAAAFADATKSPFNATSALGVTTFEATNGGTLGNLFGISFSGSIPGTSIALAAWAGGATDPSLTGVLDAVGDTRYQSALWPSSYAIDEAQAFIDARFNVSNAILDGVVFQQKTDTLANLKAYVLQMNSQSIVVVGQKSIAESTFDGPAALEMPDIACAEFIAIRALRFTQDAILTPYLTTVASSDQFGGIEMASLPYFNTLMPDMPVASPAHQFSNVDIAELTNNGVSLYGPNSAFNATIMGEMVTTYLTDSAGNSDDSYKYLNTVDTASVIREFFFANLKRRYAQTRLTTGDLIPGRDMANEASIRAFCGELYDTLADATLTQKGTAAKKDYNQNLVVTVDIATGTVTINQAPLLVSQLRVVLGTIQINFGA